MTALKFYSLA